jgi:hypothetical protein
MAVGIEQAQLEHAAAFGAGDAAELHAAVLGNVHAIDHAVGRVEQFAFALATPRACACTSKRAPGATSAGGCSAIQPRGPVPPASARRRQHRVAVTCDQAGTDQRQRGGRMLAQRGGQVGYALAPGTSAASGNSSSGPSLAGSAGLAGIDAQHDQPACGLLAGGGARQKYSSVATTICSAITIHRRPGCAVLHAAGARWR